VSLYLAPKNVTVLSEEGTGNFAFENVPFGTFQISASTPEGDFGSASGSLSSAAPEALAPIQLNGLGTVTVHVTDADGADVPGAHVSVSSLGRSSGGTTDQDGKAVVPNVRAAATVHATATHPTNGAQGQNDKGPLDPTGTLTIEVQLERLGTVRGVVFEPLGNEGVDGVQVTLAGRSTITQDGGKYSFSDLKLTSYTARAYVANRLRAQENVTLGGSEATRNLVLVGVGTVGGKVTRSGGAAVVGATVHLQSDAPTFGGPFDTTTDTDGDYLLSGVPVGPFTVSATLGADTRQDSGTISRDQDAVTVDLELLDSAVTMPSTLTDGNRLQYVVSTDGSVRRGQTFVNGEGTPRLSVVRGGTTVSFTGPSCSSGVKCVPTEENGRELVLRQAGLLQGLEATRKVFVAVDGYFMRVTDILHNPSPTDPITFSVLREARVGGTTIVGTSSGDTAVDSDDQWVAVDDSLDDDIYGQGNADNALAPTALVLSGPGGAVPTTLAASQPATNRTLLAQSSGEITLGPGETVAFLSFVSCQADRGRALASAGRLVQLPPEALAGLSPEESGEVGNFAVPPDLVSALLPLSPNDGAVSGTVLASDGATPPDAGSATWVAFRSRSPFYGRPLGNYATGTGQFAFQGVATPNAPDVVPRMDFDLTATALAGNLYHPFAVPPVAATVSFPQDGVIDLTNVAGRVLRVSSSSASWWQAPAYAVDDDVNTSWHTAFGDAANKGQAPFFEIGLPGDATIHEVRIRGTSNGENYSIHAGRVDLTDVSGAVVWSQDVDLPVVNGRRNADVAVPAVPGVRNVRFTSTDDVSANPGLAELRVLGEATLGPAREAKQDLVFAGTGRLEVQVLRSDHTPVGGSTVTLSDGTHNSPGTPTDGTGTFQWRVLPPGTYSITAKHPNQTPVATVGGVEVKANALTHQDVVFDPLGGIMGTISNAKGGRIGGTSIRLEASGFPTRTTSSASVTGLYSLPDVPPGTYTLTATDTRTNFPLSRTVTIPAGTPTTEDFTLRPVTSVKVTATVGSPAGPALTLGVVWVVEDPGRDPRFVGYLNNGGPAQFTVSGPTVTVRVETPWNNLRSFGEATVTFDEGDAVSAPIVVPGLGTLSGSLRARDGKAVTSGTFLNVLVADPDDTTKQLVTTVGTGGLFHIDQVPVRPLLLRSALTEAFAGVWTYAVTEVPVALSYDGQDLEQDALTTIGNLAIPGQVEAWEIRPSAGLSLTLYLIGRAYADVPALADPRLEVFDQDGTLVAQNDDRTATDKNSKLSFTAAGGPYVILVHGSHGATGGYRLAADDDDDSRVFRPWSGSRTFHGLVTRLEDAQPAPGQGLRLLRRGGVPADDVVLTTFAADSHGAFSIPGLWSGGLALEATDPQGVTLARREFDVAADEDPGSLDLVVPVHGTVSVHLVRGSDPVAGVAVELDSARDDVLPGDKVRFGTTDSSGTVSFVAPIGSVTARATDPARPASGPVEVTGQADEAVPAELTIDFGVIRVDVEGVVRNTSLTPLPGANVELTGFGTTISTTTDANGAYRFTNVLGARTWTITASHPKASLPQPQSFQLVLGDQNVTRDFTLTVAVLKGQVLEPDGSGVPGAQVLVCPTYTNDPCLAPYLTNGNGEYLFVGRPTWNSYYSTVKASLQDGSGLVVSAYVDFNSTSAYTITQNFVLPPTGRVFGTVTDHEGAVVPNAHVSVYEGDPYGYLAREGVTDDKGDYDFPHIQLYGGTAVRAYAEAPAGDPGEAHGQLDSGQTVKLDVQLVESADLQVALVDEGSAPLSGTVEVQSLLAPGADGVSWKRSLDVVAGNPASGHTRAPLGPFRVIHDDSSYDPGAAEGELESGQNLPVLVRRGSHVRQPQTLSGDGGSYTTDEWCQRADCGPFARTLPGGLREADYPPLARPEAQGRALRSLQLAGVGLRLRRQQYVPPSGAFARTLTTLYNPSDTPQSFVLTTRMAVDGSYQLNGSFGIGDAIGIVGQDTDLLGLVVGSKVPALREEFIPGFDTGEGVTPGALEAEHPVTDIPPHGTVAFLTFTLARTDGDLDALAARAAALADLSDPEALAALSAAERSAIVNFDVPQLGDVQGTVSYGGIAVVGAQVGLIDDAGGLVVETTTDESGGFALSAVPPGHYSVAAFDPGSGRRGRTSVDVVADGVSPAPIELFDDTALGSVHARAVWDRVGGAVTEAELVLSPEGFGPVGEANLVTDSSGEALFTGIPEGEARVRLPDFYRAQPATATVVAGQTVELEIAAPPPGNVSGRVRGAAGTVPVPYARVEALDVATGDLLTSGETDADGQYQLFDLRAGAAGFVVRAIWPYDPAVRAERSGSISQVGETIADFDLDLPIALVTGHVSFFGGTEPVQYPNVFATPSGVEDPRSSYADQSGVDGSFTMFVGGLGDFVLTAQDNASGLTGQTVVHVADLATGAPVNLQLPPSGSVKVTALDHDGNALSGAQVALSSLALAFDRSAQADASGSFTFDRVALGAFQVQAQDLQGTDLRGTATSTLEDTGLATLNVSLPETSSLEGQVLGTSYGYASVQAVSLDHDGPLGPWSAGAWASPNYTLTAPVGAVRVGAVDDSQDPWIAGVADGAVSPPAGGPSSIDVTVGNAVSLPADLAGADHFRYDVGCEGFMESGGSGNNAAYSTAYYLSLAGRGFWSSACLPAAAELGGRLLNVGPHTLAGIEVTRKVYVPPSGGFARYVEFLTNPGASPVTVPVGIDGDLASEASTRVLASPGSTAHTYALTDDAGCCHPVLGFVFAGPGGRTGTSLTQLDPAWGYFLYRWTVTIGPGETVALMHFAVQRARGDETGARQQAEALVNLTDPHALDGMSPQERAQVVNFDVP
jgi:hypothetical protein